MKAFRSARIIVAACLLSVPWLVGAAAASSEAA